MVIAKEEGGEQERKEIVRVSELSYERAILNAMLTCEFEWNGTDEKKTWVVEKYPPHKN